MNLADLWAGLVSTPLLALTLTIGAYAAALALWERAGRHPAVTPVLVATLVLGGAIVLLGLPYDRYAEHTSILGFLLGPATVALALPLHRQVARVREAAPMVLGSVLVGGGLGIVSGYWLTVWLGGTNELAASMAPKSVTTPIAMVLADQIGGIPAIAALLVIFAGIVGAAIGPRILAWCGIRDQRVIGLALGVSSHGIGTSRALQESDTTGAFSGLAMGLNGLLTSVVISLLIP